MNLPHRRKPLLIRRIPAFLLLAVFSLSSAAPGFASSDTQFFSMSDAWNKRFQYPGEQKEPRPPDIGFLKDQPKRNVPPLKSSVSKYFVPKEEEAPATAYVPPPERASLRQLKAAAEKNIEMYVNQVVTIEGRGIQRYVVSDPGLVEFFSQDPSYLQMKGIGLGTGYVHIWDNEGRFTVRIHVTRAMPPPSEAQKRATRVAETGETFKFQYSQNRSAFYEGNSWPDLGRTSLDYDQNFGMSGDTPYGKWDSSATLRNIPGKGPAEYSQASGHLTNGRIGPFEHFDLHVGDNQLKSDLLAIPNIRLRGFDLDYRDPGQRMAYSVFHGRELPSILGTLGQIGAQKDVDSFISGGIYDFKVAEGAHWKTAFAHAYGQQRPDLLNNDTGEFVQTYQLGKRTIFESDIAYDSEHLSHTATVDVDLEKARIKTRYRDISNEFQTIIGNPPFQGEQGVKVDALLRPTEAVEFSYAGDAFRDRLFPAPGETDRFNVNHDAYLTLAVTPMSTLKFDVGNHDETGRFSQIRDRTESVAYTQNFSLFGRTMSVFGRFQDRNFENLQNPILNYKDERLLFGYQTPLFWDINFSVQEQIDYLEETEARRITHPRATNYALTWSRQIDKTPFWASWTARYRDEEEADSDRSFLTGEDRLELSASLNYRIDNMEFFIDASYHGIEADRLTLEPYRTEAEVSTGLRYLFDTGLTWQASGPFEGFVFNDVNNDGKKQPSEPGFRDAVVRIGESEFRTNDAGYYRSTPVTGKSAQISLGEGVPPGFAPSTPSNVTALIRQGRAQRVDFGLSAHSYVDGFIFNDLNTNGVYDPSEPGVIGARVTLDGKPAVYTDSRGSYRLVDLSVGPHEVGVDFASLPLGYLPAGAMSRKVELFEGMGYRLDFVILSQRSLRGRVFADANGNGYLDGAEKGIAGIKVLLGSRETVSDAEGYYLFDQLPPGDYVLRLDTAGTRYGSSYSEERHFGADPIQYKIDVPVTADNA